MSVSGPSLWPQYKYNYLSSDSLRLLNLRPDQPSSPIDCELVEVSRYSRYAYEAVSWCWGSEKWDRQIRMHRSEQAFCFSVSANLESALRAFRRPGVARTLWIDAICIDQDNTVEKSFQIPLMGRIYQEAICVCLWLGEANNESKIALEFIRSDILQLQKADKLARSSARSLSQWAALVNLMQRPWFSRRWVIQEIAFASRATVQCGTDFISWQTFVDAVSFVMEIENASRMYESKGDNEPLYRTLNTIGDLPALSAAVLVQATGNIFRREKDGRLEQRLGIEYPVSSLSVFESTDPWDTIYALLGLASDASPRAANPEPEAELALVSPGVEHQLRLWAKRFTKASSYLVDYDRSVSGTYGDFVKFCIQKPIQTRGCTSSVN